MDLIYTNESGKDLGCLKNYTLDLAFGNEENNFELSVDIYNNMLEKSSILYVEGTEYGGIVDSLEVDTDREKIVYYGRTWHGILKNGFIVPDGDYKIVSGNIKLIIDDIVGKYGFICEDTLLAIDNYEFDRFIDIYDGLLKMLKSIDYTLRLVFIKGIVKIRLYPIANYYDIEDLENKKASFKIGDVFNSVNHLICLGVGELEQRQIYHLYINGDGEVSENQFYFGKKEIMNIYENVNSEDLRSDGVIELKKLNLKDTINIDFNSDNNNFNINDIIEVKESITGVSARKTIVKKIINLNNTDIDVSYKVGD